MHNFSGLNASNEKKEESWSDFNLNEVFDVEDKPMTGMDHVRRDIYGHKESFLPTQRNLYLPLYFSNLNRFGANENFLSIEEI